MKILFTCWLIITLAFASELPDWVIPNTKLAAIEQIKVFAPIHSIIKTSHQEVVGSGGEAEVEVSLEFKNAESVSYVQLATCRPFKNKLFCHYVLKSETGATITEADGEFFRKE